MEGRVHEPKKLSTQHPQEDESEGLDENQLVYPSNEEMEMTRVKKSRHFNAPPRPQSESQAGRLREDRPISLEDDRCVLATNIMIAVAIRSSICASK